MAGDKRVLVTNDDEPEAGDYGFTFYNHSHPVHGDSSVIRSLKNKLRGLSGKKVKATIRGQRRNPSTGRVRKWSLQKTFVYGEYADLFGAGSVYLDALHQIRDDDSDDEIVTNQIIVETV